MRFAVPVRAAMLCFVLASVAHAQGLPAGRADLLGFSAARLARVDTVMQQFVDQHRVPGIVTLIARHGRVVQSGAYGFADQEAGRRMATNALFRMASMSKAITSVGVMILVEEGKLRLADPVSKFLPSFANATVMRLDSGRAVRLPIGRAITIRDLLTHTAGISYGTDSLVADLYRAAGLGPAAGYGWYFADKTEPICASMDRLGGLPFVAQPGERFVYGYNTDILGCVIERASGQPLDVFLERRIFGPLRMTDTRFFIPESQRARLTAVYSATPEGGYERAAEGPRGQGSYVDGPRTGFSGGAGLVSTAGDYIRFLQMLLGGGALDGVRLLGPRTVALMTMDHLGTLYKEPGNGFGLGFQILTNPGLAGQYGSVGAYRWGGAYGTNYWVDPGDDLVAVVLYQVIPAGTIDVYDRFRTLVYQAMVAGGSRPGGTP